MICEPISPVTDRGKGPLSMQRLTSQALKGGCRISNSRDVRRPGGNAWGEQGDGGCEHATWGGKERRGGRPRSGRGRHAGLVHLHVAFEVSWLPYITAH